MKSEREKGKRRERKKERGRQRGERGRQSEKEGEIQRKKKGEGNIYREIYIKREKEGERGGEYRYIDRQMKRGRDRKKEQIERYSKKREIEREREKVYVSE